MIKSLPSFCTSNEDVISSILNFCKRFDLPVLIESTSNQVNQYRGYTKLNPSEFKKKVKLLAKRNLYSSKKILFGGDHLGPLPWKKMKRNIALKRGQKLVEAYLNSNFNKLHIDTTIKMIDEKILTKNTIKDRSKEILNSFQNKKLKNLILVLGSEVPTAGGSFTVKRNDFDYENEIISEIKLYKKIYKELNLNKDLNLVVDSGMSFNDKKIFSSNRKKLNFLRKASQLLNVQFEAHSTDYQNINELKELVKSNFKFLKVGPELTYYFTRAIFEMHKIEKKFIKKNSKIKVVIFNALKNNNKYWIDYYKHRRLNDVINGQFDRLRYYWNETSVVIAKKKLFKNIDNLDKMIIFKELGLKKKDYLKLDFTKTSNSKIIVNCFLYKTLKKYYKACNYNV